MEQRNFVDLTKKSKFRQIKEIEKLIIKLNIGAIAIPLLLRLIIGLLTAPCFFIFGDKFLEVDIPVKFWNGSRGNDRSK